MAGCYRLFILNGPNGVTEIPVNGTVTSVKNRGSLSNINEVQIDGVISFTLPMYHPAVSGILSSRWCPGAIQQDPYKIRLMVGHEILPQRFLYCGTLSEGGKTFTVTAGWAKDHFVIGANECRLCDIFKRDIVDIVNGGTFEICDSVVLGNSILGSGQNPWDQSTNNCEYEDGVSDPFLMMPAYYGGTYYRDITTPADFRPWFNLRYILKEAACKLGHRLKAPIFDHPLFDRSWIYILADNYGDQAKINEYGSLEAAFEDYRWKVALTPGSDLYQSGVSTPNGHCIIFDQTISDPQSIVNGQPSFASWTHFELYGNLLQGVCLRFKLFQTNEDWSGDISISIYQVSPEFSPGGPVNLPGGGTATINVPVSTLIAEDTFNVSYDENNEQFIIEGIIEIDRLNIEKPTILRQGELWACISRSPTTTPETSIPVLEVEYFEFFNKPKEFFYGIGEYVNFCDAVRCDISVLDIYKKATGLIGGYLDFNTATCEVCIYPPVNVEMPDGQIIEGYNKEGDPVKLEGLIICDSHEGVKDDANQPRYCRVGFAKSTDSYINDLYEDDNEPFSYLIDRGGQYDGSQTVDKLNHGFEPTILRLVDNISCNGVPVYLPNLSDNEDGRVSKNIGCRILLCSSGQQDYQQTGQVPEIAYCDPFDNNGQLQKRVGFVQGYQVPIDSQVINADPAEILSYDPADNDDPTNPDAQFDFYNLFMRFSNLDAVGQPVHSFQFLHCANIFMRANGGFFRHKVMIAYRGKVYKLIAQQFQIDHCLGICTVSGYQPTTLNADCLTAPDVEVNTCQNSASISCDFDKGTNCYTVLVGGNYVSPISQVVWEMQEENLLGTGWGPSTNPSGTLTMLELCDLNKPTRVRFQVIFDEVDGVVCPPVLSNWVVKDPCPNFPIIACIDPVEKIDPCENCFKLNLTGIVCSKIESITGTLEVLDYNGSTLQTIAINEGPINDIEPLDWASDEICGAGPCFRVLDGLINYQDGCDPTEWTLNKVFRDCCCDLAGECIDCVYTFDDLCGYKLEWYQICNQTTNVGDVLTLGLNGEYSLNMEEPKVDDDLKEYIKCNYPFWGGDQVKPFDDQLKVWYVGILSKQNDPKNEGDEPLLPCDCLLYAYYHAPFISGGTPGGYTLPTFTEERPRG